ncbi:MAG: glycosyltransferase, partial [Mesorhizobium sp.]|nr:glycosyltransferase [Mesorhizobium sp.]
MKHVAGRSTITMITTSVCIATFRRPTELERLLEALCAQRGAPDFEVVVVDNDPQQSAKAIAERFSAAIALTYCHE